MIGDSFWRKYEGSDGTYASMYDVIVRRHEFLNARAGLLPESKADYRGRLTSVATFYRSVA